MVQNGELGYLSLLRRIREEGEVKGDRTGTGTLSLFGPQYEHDFSEGFPLLTTKTVHLPSIIHELLWFLSGSTNIAYLKANNVRIWDEWATADGELGPVYGHQWRKWKGVDGEVHDQVAEVVHALKTNPNSRRIIISGWNVGDLPVGDASGPVQVERGKMALPPCHVLYQFYVVNGKLSCKLTQRSADMFLGVPFNLASVALLTMMLAHQCDLLPGRIIHSLGDAHLYSNHLAQADIQLSRTPTPLPTLKIVRKPESIFDYKFEDFVLEDYAPQGKLAAKVAV